VSDHDTTRELLVRTLNAERFADPEYLLWFYDRNPRGAALEENVDENGRRVAHYAVLPAVFRTPAGPTEFIFSSNVATDPDVRRGGLFREMAERMYKRAAATGAPGMVGVGNDQSTVVVVDRFGWHALRPMPVKVCVPFAPARGVDSYVCDATFLASARFSELTADLDWVPVRDWAQSWDTEFLRWRLQWPGRTYTLHVSQAALAVSYRAQGPGKMPFAVLLKVFPRRGAALPVTAARFVTAACRSHRAPLCVYAGWNAHVRVHGVPAPRRLQPSPLNVVLKSLDEIRVPGPSFRLDTFEFLDMDSF
jgi:GNAT superfamily N-acetyltransferase